MRRIQRLSFLAYHIVGDITPDRSRLFLQEGGDAADSNIDDTEIVYIELTSPIQGQLSLS